MNPTRLLRGLAVLFLGLSQAKSQTLRPPQGTPAPASRYLDPSQGYGAQSGYGGYSAQPAYGGYGAMSSYGAYPAPLVYGGYPAPPAYGAYPSQPAYGGYPAAPAYGAYPAYPSYPPVYEPTPPYGGYGNSGYGGYGNPGYDVGLYGSGGKVQFVFLLGSEYQIMGVFLVVGICLIIHLSIFK